MYAQMINVLKKLAVEWDEVSGRRELKLECPKCQEAGRTYLDKKLYVNWHESVFLCQRCNWKGQTQTLVAYLRLISKKSYYASWTWGVPSFGDLENALVETRVRILQATSDSLLPLNAMLAWESPEARDYLGGRSLSQESCEHFGLLYAPDGYYARRILIPICDYFGEFRTFVARAIDIDAEKRYLFPRGCRTSSLLYNAHRIVQDSVHEVWITEGVFDAMYCAPNAVATFGKHITDAQMRLLRHMRPERVVLLWDWDAWAKTPELWEQATMRLAKFFPVTPVKLPRPDTDPTDYTRRELFHLIRETKRTGGR